MEKWILIVSMIINLQDDKEWEQQLKVEVLNGLGQKILNGRINGLR